MRTSVTLSLVLRRPHRVCSAYRSDDGGYVLQVFGQQVRLSRERER